MKDEFNIGDKVRIIIHGDMGKTGVIVAEGIIPTTTVRDVHPPREEMQIFWWKVKLDLTGVEREFPHDKLEKIV